jgi:hypothetical protein
VVAAVKPSRRAELVFSEYVHVVSAYIMLSPKDLTRFLFQHADDENKFCLRFVVLVASSCFHYRLVCECSFAVCSFSSLTVL